MVISGGKWSSITVLYIFFRSSAMPIAPFFFLLDSKNLVLRARSEIVGSA
jgi:hypothetical protein